MKIWLVSQTVNSGYDTYDSMVVCAATSDEARHMKPSPENCYSNLWAAPEDVQVEYIGEANPNSEQRIICASFNAG